MTLEQEKTIENALFIITAIFKGKIVGLTRVNRECVELKRFFVRKAHREKGIASGILLFLENEVKEQDYSIIKL